MTLQRSKAHPIATAAFYEMLAAFSVLLVVVRCANSSWTGLFGSIGLIVPMVGCVMLSVAVRRGEIIIPVLGERERERSNKECRQIRNALIASVIVTVLIAAGIVALTATHRLTGGWAIAMFTAFNVYGWFSYSWWREAYPMITKYEAKQKAEQAVREQETPVSPATTVSVATPEPLRLRVGNGGNP